MNHNRRKNELQELAEHGDEDDCSIIEAELFQTDQSETQMRYWCGDQPDKVWCCDQTAGAQTMKSDDGTEPVAEAKDGESLPSVNEEVPISNLAKEPQKQKFKSQITVECEGSKEISVILTIEIAA